MEVLVKQIVVNFLTPIVGIVEGAAFAGDWVSVIPFSG